MEKYILQFIEQLNQAAKDKPLLYPYHMDYPTPEEMEWIPELAKVPFKTIGEWTGIDIEAFPPAHLLDDEQKMKVAKAVDKLWEAFHFDFNIDEADKDQLYGDLWYRMIIDCWEDEVQYLPQSGCDIELCYGDATRCRMGEDCFCLHDPPDLSWDELPPKEQDVNEEDFPF